MRVIYRKIRHVRYLHIKRNVEKVWGARYLSKNTVVGFYYKILFLLIHMPLWCGQGQCYCEHVLLKLFQAQILLIFIAQYVSECLPVLVFVTINNTSMLRCCASNVPVVIARVVIFKT